MLDKLKEWDTDLFLFLNNLRAEWLDTPMFAISDPRFSLPWFLLIFFFVWKKYDWRYLVLSLLGMALVITLCDQISVHWFKNVFERFRPTHQPLLEGKVNTVMNWEGKYYNGGKFGFVSSHAANYFGIGTFFFFILRPSKTVFWVVFSWVTLVSYSRIYLGVHYPGDIFMGSILGIVLGALVYYIFQKIERKILWTSQQPRIDTLDS